MEIKGESVMHNILLLSPSSFFFPFPPPPALSPGLLRGRGRWGIRDSTLPRVAVKGVRDTSEARLQNEDHSASLAPGPPGHL